MPLHRATTALSSAECRAPEHERRRALQTIGRKRGAFKIGDARTINAARLGGIASAALIDEETRAERSRLLRRWWGRFTPEERREMVRRRLKHFHHSGHKPGWTLNLPADHPGVAAMRRNGIECMRALTARESAKYWERVRYAHRAYFYQHRPIAEIAVELSVKSATITDYLRVPLTDSTQVRFL